MDVSLDSKHANEDDYEIEVSFWYQNTCLLGRSAIVAED